MLPGYRLEANAQAATHLPWVLAVDDPRASTTRVSSLSLQRAMQKPTLTIHCRSRVVQTVAPAPAADAVSLASDRGRPAASV